MCDGSGSGSSTSAARCPGPFSSTIWIALIVRLCPRWRYTHGTRRGFKPWRRSSACSTTTRSTATRRPTRATTVPKIERYHDGQTTPTPAARSTSRRASCSAASRASSGCARSSRTRGHTLVVTSDKDGPDSVFERELPDAEVVISQPFWPAYLTAERIAKAPKLKLALTAGIGSDHVDLQAAIDARHHGRRGHVLEQHQRRRARRDDDPRARAQLHPVAPVGASTAAGTSPTASSRSYDLEGMQVGTVAAGRIGSAVLRRLKPFEVGLHYTDRHRLPERGRAGARRHLPRERRVARAGVRRRHDQRAAAPRDREPVRRATDREDEARRVPDQHGAREDLRPRRRRARAARAASSPATPATSGSRSRRRATTRGGRCRTTA